MRVSDVDKAFGATFVDIEGLNFINSLAYRKRGYLHVYLKAGLSDKEIDNKVQNEIDQVFETILRISKNDVELKDRHTHEYQFTVLNEKNIQRSFNRINRAFKRKKGQ